MSNARDAAVAVGPEQKQGLRFPSTTAVLVTVTFLVRLPALVE